MAKKLLPAQMEELKAMALKGIAPEDISRHFGIAISSVHNYKNQLKAQGIELPSVKGMRPTGTTQPAGSISKPHNVGASAPSASAKTTPVPGKNYQHLVVNGVHVNVSNNAKSISIDENGINIKF